MRRWGYMTAVLLAGAVWVVPVWADVPPADAPTDTPPATDPPKGTTVASDVAAKAGGLPDAILPTLELHVTPREGLHTGDVLRLQIVADARTGDDVTFPEQDLGSWEIVGRQVQVASKQARDHFTFDLELMALEPGEHTLPSLELRVVTRDGQVGFVSTEAQTLRVASLLGNEPDAKPRAATAPVDVMQDDYTLLWVLGGLLAALLIAGLTWLAARYWQRRVRTAAPAPPPRPPWEVALERLTALQVEREAMLQAGQHAELIDRTSDAVREYLGAVYGFDGLERTTDELLKELRHSMLGADHQDAVRRFLAHSDLVKFANMESTTEEIDQVFATAFELVRAARPAPVLPSQLGSPPSPTAPPGAGPAANQAGGALTGGSP